MDDIAKTKPYTFTTVDVPGASSTQAFGINARGTVVGDYIDSNTGARVGFIDDRGSFTTIDLPGAVHGTFAEPKVRPKRPHNPLISMASRLR
jgi:hypothetical protein